MHSSLPPVIASSRYAILMAATSLSVLGYEIVLMRLLSIGLWYHFASMVISMALLGFGASGSLLFLTYDRIKRNLNGWLVLLSAVASISFPFAFSLSQRMGVDPLQLIYQPAQWVYMLVTYVLMAIPFLFTGGIIGIILTHRAEDAHQMYAIDLLGAGCGALLIIPALYTGPPWRLLPILGYLILLGATGCCVEGDRRGIGFGTLLISALVLTALYFWVPPVPRIHNTKALPMTLAFPDARIEARTEGPLGMIHIVGSSQIRHVPGLSLNFGLNPEDPEATLPEQKAIFVDADGLSPITSFTGDVKALKYLDYTSMALPYHVRDVKKVLVVGAGGGSDVLAALQHRAKAIIALEMNKQVVDLLLGPFAAFSGHLFTRPDVTVEIREARQFLHSTDDTYDLIQLSLIESFVTAAGGMHSAAEDYLFTVEAFKEYLAHLTDSGMVAVTRWLKLPPRDSFRMLSTVRMALQQNHITHPERHILFIRSWKTFTILVSNSPFLAEEIVKAEAFCSLRSFDMAYYAGMKMEEANKYDIQEIPYYYNGAKALYGDDPEAFLQDYLFDVSAITDDRPFFSHFFKWEKAPVFLKHLKREWLPMVEMGYLFILATLAQAVFAGGFLILVPLMVQRWIKRRSKQIRFPLRLSATIGPVVYFGGIGLGFMFLEMAFISKYTLLLSHPVYAAAVVLSTVLVFAGCGSLCVRRLQAVSHGFLWIPVIVISCWVLFHTMAGNWVFDGALKFPFWGRFIITVLLLLVPSFFLGWLFPSGLRMTAMKYPDLVPWAWGINGCASVIGAVLAKSLAVSMGFHFLMITACLLYVLAVSTFYVSFHDSKPQHADT
jgi:spermidine synthase